MFSNYYLIHGAAIEIASRCTGDAFAVAYSVNAGELRIELMNGNTIIAILNPGQVALYLDQRTLAPAKRNVQYFFRELKGLAITSVNVDDNDKHVTLVFGDHSLHLRFFDSPNAYLKIGTTDVSYFKKDSPRKTASPQTTITDKVHDQLRATLPMLGHTLKDEFYFRYGMNANNEVSDRGDFESKCEEFDTELRSSEYCYLYSTPKGLLLSPIKLLSFNTSPQEKFESYSEGIRSIIRLREKQKKLISAQEALRQDILRSSVRLEQTIKEITKNVGDSTRAERYAAIGQELLANAHTIEKGQTETKLYFQDKEHLIPLDPKKTVYQNAERFFEKSRDSRARKTDLLKTLDSAKSKLLRHSDASHKIDNLDSPAQVQTLRKQLVDAGLLSATKESLANDTSSGFRKFVVFGGYTVLVGRNAKQNDDLTLRVAKKEDIWLHARHVPGSHVVLQTGNRQNIPKEALDQAAQIAAYFSDAKTQAHAPVAYTRKKYVRKPRGAAPGAVIIEREEVVIVTPQLIEQHYE